MALTPSTMLSLGTKLPQFTLTDTFGKKVSTEDFSHAKAHLVIFLCNHCPYVKHIADVMAKVTTSYLEKGVSVLGIMSNDVEKYPDDRPEMMGEEAARRGYRFPYLFDHDQKVAKSFEAACTPEFYVFDASQSLVYRGQFDDARPGNGIPPSGHDVIKALDAVLEGREVSKVQKPSIGCNIKWRVGSEPSYFRR